METILQFLSHSPFELHVRFSSHSMGIPWKHGSTGSYSHAHFYCDAVNRWCVSQHKTHISPSAPALSRTRRTVTLFQTPLNYWSYTPSESDIYVYPHQLSPHKPSSRNLIKYLYRSTSIFVKVFTDIGLPSDRVLDYVLTTVTEQLVSLWKHKMKHVFPQWLLIFVGN